VVVKPDADCHGQARPGQRVQDQFGISTPLQVDHETRRGLIDIEPPPATAAPDRVAHPVAALAAHLRVEGLGAVVVGRGLPLHLGAAALAETAGGLKQRRPRRCRRRGRRGRGR
jgi:hypothetical protein